MAWKRSGVRFPSAPRAPPTISALPAATTCSTPTQSPTASNRPPLHTTDAIGVSVRTRPPASAAVLAPQVVSTWGHADSLGQGASGLPFSTRSHEAFEPELPIRYTVVTAVEAARIVTADATTPAVRSAVR